MGLWSGAAQESCPCETEAETPQPSTGPVQGGLESRCRWVHSQSRRRHPELLHNRPSPLQDSGTLPAGRHGDLRALGASQLAWLLQAPPPALAEKRDRPGSVCHRPPG